MVCASTPRWRLIIALLALPIALGCADKSNHGTLAGGGSDSGTKLPPGPSCSTPQEGCECSDEGEVIDCGSVLRHADGATTCSMGERVCVGGEWSACEGSRVVKLPDPAPGQRAQGLGDSQACADNPCDPYCQVVIDDSDDLDVGDGGLTAADDGLTLTAVPADPASFTCTDILLDPQVQTLTVTEIRQTSGLKGEYFNQRDHSITQIPASWTVTATRVDATVNFEWGNGSPGVSGIGADDYSVRWSGYVFPPADGDYTFYTRTDDGVRLWIDGSLVIDYWQTQAPTQYASAPIALTQGVPVAIRMEYFEHGGGASAQLKWSSASIPQSVISDTYLSPTLVREDPYVTDPPNATLTVGVVPPTCYEGAFTAAWGIDALDRATVSDGVVTLHSAIAGPMKVSAYVQEFSDTATVNVVVNANDVSEAPAGSPAIFAGASTGPDTTTILYPYDQTVLPLSLKPPVLQWDTGGVAASAVKVTLTYPAVGTPTFTWSKTVAAPSNGRFSFTRDQWSLFERSAKGGSGRISLQRVVAGQLKDAVSKTVTFATTPLRGNIYYTQYGNGSNIKRLDPSGDYPAVNAFATSSGCPVCHTVSANGTKFVTSHYFWSSDAGGISNVDSSGNLTRLSDIPNPSAPYSNGSPDFRGFAWAPLTPDGSLLFATNNFFGNTNQSVVGINPTTRTVSLPAAMVSGGMGSGLLAEYYATNNFTGPSWRRIDPRPDYVWAGSPGGPIPADGFSVVWSGDVEGFFTENVQFEVETNCGVRLTVGGNVIINQLANAAAGQFFTGNAPLVQGGKTSIKLEAVDTAPAGQTVVKLRWRSATNAGLYTPYTLIPQSQLFPAGGPYGAVATYDDNNAAHGVVTRVESDLGYDWGTAAPVVGSSNPLQLIDADNFTSVWEAQVEAPVTTNLQWCIRSDDGVRLYVNGVLRITGGGVTDTCAAAMAVTAGQKYAIRIEHTELTGDAYVQLSWRMSSFITTRELVPRARTFLPTSFTAPATGLSAVFYDTMDFGGPLAASNATTSQAYTTYVPNLDYDFGSERHSRGRALTGSDTMSGRFTGRLTPACTGVHEFEILADDTAMIWIGGERLINHTSWGTRYAARWLDSALQYDFKVDWTENSGGAGMRIRWKPACNGATSYTAIPQSRFSPTGYTRLDGYLRQGGDNGNGYSYVAWQTPNAVGVPPVDVTSQSPGNWGLGQSAMMVPTFSPDGTKLVFVDGDSATGAGWRKGLSTFDFDQGNKLFRNRRQLVNHFPAGDVIKWPAYESDSKSVIYQTTTPGDACCRKTDWAKYGYMGPTNYFEDPGKLWSVDSTAASPVPVELAKLNNGERAVDRNKAYQATMLPAPAGGYRWTVFTSTRPYGNTLNLPAVQQDYSDVNNYVAMMNTSQLQSMLWVSAIDDAVSAGTDRSHPAFFLPNQAFSESGGGYLNERAYWVTQPCRAAGSGPASTCDVDEDCCGGTASPKTAVCRIDNPITTPPTRHCASVPPPNACIAAGGACTQNSDCCFNYPCVENLCVQPPPLPTYPPANFERLYTAECGTGTLPVWRFFDWQAETPSSSSIEIYVESADDPDDLHTLPVAPTPVNIAGVAHLATVTGATVMGWVGADVGQALADAGYPQKKYLLVTLRLIPNTTITAPPVVTDWRQSYSCPPQE